MRCEVCGSDWNVRRCPYCGGYFCEEHVAPGAHFCDAYWNVPVRVKRRSVSLAAYGVNNIVLIVCTILFFVAILIRQTMIDLFALHPHPLSIATRPWQILTSIFLHVGFWHFFVNMLILLFFGGELERRVGSGKYAEIFMVSGIAGSLGYVLYANAIGDYNTPALGASAAIFGVMGCLAVIAPEIRIVIFPVPIPIGIRTALVLFAAYDFWMMILSSLGVFYTNVANVAHLAGLLVGLYYGRRLGRRRWYG